MPKIKSEILKLLLDKDMTTAEIADRLGYGKRKNKYDIVDRPLKELVNEGFIERSKVKVGKERGRPPALYSFKRDMITILKVYENFPDVRDHLRKSDWVRRLVAERFGKAGNEIDEMLKLSPSFFELAIRVENIRKLASLWYTYIKNPFLEAEEPLPEAFRLLFAFCVFLDEVENKVHPMAYELLRKFANESLQYDFEVEKEMLKDAVSTELMKALKRIAGLIRSGDASLQQLLWLLDEYERAEARLSKLKGDERDRLIKQLDEIYNRIAVILGVSILK